MKGGRCVRFSLSHPIRQWPYRPDFNQFKRQAKELLKAYRAGDANAVAEVQRHEQAPDPTAFALHDAQRVLARSYGFTSWQKLKSYVQTIQPYWRPLEPKSDDDANRFLRLACITYFDDDHPSRRVRARQLFAEKPHLAKANIYTAAAVGDVAAVADFLTKKRRRACERRAVRLGTAAVRGVLTTRQRSRRALDVRSSAAVDRAWRRPERGLPVGGGLRPYRADGSARPGRGRRGSRRRAVVAAAASTLGRVRAAPARSRRRPQRQPGTLQPHAATRTTST